MAGQIAERWLHPASRSVVIMRSVLGGGEGFNIELITTLPIGQKLTRQTYSPSISLAAERVSWLMRQVPGTWLRLPADSP